jgi:hypothetical protein
MTAPVQGVSELLQRFWRLATIFRLRGTARRW